MLDGASVEQARPEAVCAEPLQPTVPMCLGPAAAQTPRVQVRPGWVVEPLPLDSECFPWGPWGQELVDTLISLSCLSAASSDGGTYSQI